MFPPGLILDVARSAGRSVRPTSNPNEFEIQCPWPERHRHGDKDPSCRLNQSDNVFYCDPCGQGGGVKELAGALGVQLPGDPGSSGALLKEKKRLVFVASGPVSPATQRHFSEQLGKTYSTDTWAAFGALEGLTHIDKNSTRAEDAVAFPMANGGFHAYRYRRSDKRKRWAFTDGGKPSLIMAGLDHADPVILAEGEWDAMRAYESGFAVATGTGAGIFKHEWSAQLSGREVAIVYDVDEAGQAGAIKALHILGEHPSRKWLVQLPLSGNDQSDGKDLSDYLALHSADEFRGLIDQQPTEDAGLAGLTPEKSVVAAQIDAVLSMEGPARIKRREAAKLVVSDLQLSGDLVRAQAGRLFWFDREHQRLYDLDAFPFRALFLKRYDINPTEPEFAHVFEAVKTAARAHGRQVTVCRFCYYDRNRNRLYVHGGPDRVLRLDGIRIARVDNGTDGVLFEDVECPTVPLEALDLQTTGDPIAECILDRVNFIRGAGVVLSHDQQKLVLRVWILSVFFPELLPAKCLLLLYGEKGSGKTTTLRVILKLLLGPTANVTPLINKEDGFNAAVTSEYLLVLDNVDSHSRWIEDRLATVATGQTIRLRKLYTTNEMLSFPTRCCIALTARTPRFRRDDVVDRLQILRVARLESFSKESDWYAEIEEHRAGLWAQILHELNKVVASLAITATGSPDRIRMADWAFVVTTIGESLGQGDAIRKALEASELDKAHFLLEADSAYDLLHAIAMEYPSKDWKAGELFAELKRRSEDADIEFSIKSPKSLGRILHRLEPALRLMITFSIRTEAHDGQAVYTLAPLGRTGE